MFANNKEF